MWVRSDQFGWNDLYGSAGNRSNGEKVDPLEGLDAVDQVIVQDVSTEMLGFGFVDHVFSDGQRASGIGIWADDFLEAIYTEGDLRVDQLQAMTRGELG